MESQRTENKVISYKRSWSSVFLLCSRGCWLLRSPTFSWKRGGISQSICRSLCGTHSAAQPPNPTRFLFSTSMDFSLHAQIIVRKHCSEWQQIRIQKGKVLFWLFPSFPPAGFTFLFQQGSYTFSPYCNKFDSSSVCKGLWRDCTGPFKWWLDHLV